MHILLFAFHAVLVIFRYHLGNRAFRIDNLVPDVLSSSLFEKIGFVPNVIIKIYLVPLLYLTQLLALRRDLHLKQSLTAMHDKSQAWLSLGATSVTLFKYTDLLTGTVVKLREELKAFGNVLSVFVYLAAGLLLGIVAPDLITAEVIYGDTTDFEPLTSSLSRVGQNASLLQNAMPVVNLLSLLANGENVNTNGLFENIVYDIPNFATSRPVPASAIAFNVSCQLVPGAVQAGAFNPVDGTFPISVHEELMNIDITPIPRAMNIRPAVWRNGSAEPVPPVLFLTSTLPILNDPDDQDDPALNDYTLGYGITLNSTLEPTTCIVSWNCAPVNFIQLLACTVSTVRGSKDSFQILTNTYPFVQPNYPIDGELDVNMTTVWSNWTLSDSPTDTLLANVGSLPKLAPPSHDTQFFKMAGVNRTGNYTFTVLEENVMEALGYYTSDTEGVVIDWLEWVLAQAIASIFWRAAVTPDAINDSITSLTFEPFVHYYLAVRRWQPWLGTIASGVMLILAIQLTRQPSRHPQQHEPHVSGLGVLELTWLLGRDANQAAGVSPLTEKPEDSGEDQVAQTPPPSAKGRQGIAQQMAELENPTTENLRAQGKKVEVEFTDY